MTTVRRGVALTPMELRRDVIVRMAVLADDLGYEVFSVAEGWGLDSTVLLAEIATVTRRIKLAAGILSVWSRTPGTLAMAAATLHQLSAGRFVLGLGASTSHLVEGWHGLPFARPADRLRQVTAGVRSLLAGQRAVPAVPGARPLRLGQPPVTDLPIWLAASGERTIRVAAELADGWYPLYLRRERCHELAAEIRRLRADAGRPPLTVAVGPLTVVDPDPVAARTIAAACTAFYLAAMGEIYPRVVTAQGLGEQVDLVRAANPSAGRTLGVVPDAAQILLDEFTAYGDAADVRKQLRSWDDVADITMVGIPPGIGWPQIEATLRAAAPGAPGRNTD
ncbi:LLM class flavin-dependent oxidoreductase [Nonomuraea sp. NPDC050663]|uniref:LLM class flavin-dependent oxidoreductase n=1 Tax=Nonomuraea sp. NPDC050663 TaxID=3364370 RepID=UPI00379F2278